MKISYKLSLLSGLLLAGIAQAEPTPLKIRYR